ncbi:MAG: 2-oxoacid:acceptor oxidoreductase family protein [Dehalococcoidia bacterium]|nr:2-oxoacid:acceptor oxidoreductase family protein [Dehalococcoidia bacterium]
MLEVRWHGRGGMGSVTSAELFADAVIDEGRYAQSFPSFGPERRGAPVTAFLRISDEFIRVRTDIAKPDVLVVIDPKLLDQIDVTVGLKDTGKIIVNTSKSAKEVKAKYGFGKWKVATVDGMKIARETIKLPIANTAMMGALDRLTGSVKMESLEERIHERFGARAGANIEAMKRAYNELDMED